MEEGAGGDGGGAGAAVGACVTADVGVSAGAVAIGSVGAVVVAGVGARVGLYADLPPLLNCDLLQQPSAASRHQPSARITQPVVTPSPYRVDALQAAKH